MGAFMTYTLAGVIGTEASLERRGGGRGNGDSETAVLRNFDMR